MASSVSPGRVYIGGASVKEQDLQQLFGKYGKIISTMIRRDYSFVELEDKRDADVAIKNLDGITWEGKKLRVEPANARKDPAEKGNCFACGKDGHWSRECPNSSSRDKKACFNCGKVGHMAKECQGPKSDRRGRDRGRDYDYDRPRRGDRYRERDPPPYRGRDDYPRDRGYYDEPRGPPPSYRDEYRDDPYAASDYGYGRGRSRSPGRYGAPPPPPRPRSRSPPRSPPRAPPPYVRARSPGRPLSPPRAYVGQRGPSPPRAYQPPVETRPYSPPRGRSPYRGAPSGYPETQNGAYGRY